MKDKYPCPGHEGKCEFCKSEYGNPRSVAGMLEIDRVTGERKVDPCCRACANNLKSKDRLYQRTSIS